MSVPEEILAKARTMTNLEKGTKYLLLNIIPINEIANSSLSGKQPKVNEVRGVTFCRPKIDVGKITRVRGNIMNYFM